MLKRLLFISFTALIVAACSKDKVDTRPSIEIKSLSSTIIPVNSALELILEFTDKEGDISDTLFIKKIRLNQVQVPTIRDSFPLLVPEFPEKSSGTIRLLLDYQNHLISAVNPPLTGNPPVAEPDTLVIQMVLQDLAGNRSDTISTEPIVVIR